MIVDKTHIQNLQQELAFALKEEARLKKEAEEAELAYQAKFAEMVASFEAANPELAAANRTKREAASKSREQIDELRTRLKKVVPGYWEWHPEEAKAFDGISLSRDKVVSYDEDELFEAALQYAPWLLKLDEKAVQTFAIKNAIENKLGGFTLPARMYKTLPIFINVVVSAEISDKTLIKNAPAEKPAERKWYLVKGGGILELTAQQAAEKGVVDGPFDTQEAAEKDAIPF